jgi:hypothetical protein
MCPTDARQVYSHPSTHSSLIRSMQATLTDGRDAFWGCVNTTMRATTGGDVIGCDDADIRNATFSFTPGETVKTLTIWPGSNLRGDADSRAGFIHFETSLVSYTYTQGREGGGEGERLREGGGRGREAKSLIEEHVKRAGSFSDGWFM